MGFIDNLTDRLGNILYPRTLSEAVIDGASQKKLSDIINEFGFHMGISSKKHITESGSAGEGYYIKFDDGSIFQFVSTRYSGPIQSEWGALYSSPRIVLNDWPIPFIEMPYCFHTLRSTNSAWLSSGTGLSATSPGSVYIIRPTATDDSASYFIHSFGFWKWK